MAYAFLHGQVIHDRYCDWTIMVIQFFLEISLDLDEEVELSALGNMVLVAILLSLWEQTTMLSVVIQLLDDTITLLSFEHFIVSSDEDKIMQFWIDIRLLQDDLVT